MSQFDKLYLSPPLEMGCEINGPTLTALDFSYGDASCGAESLYQKGKQAQWDADIRIDWSQGLDERNLLSSDDRLLPFYGSDAWQRSDERDRCAFRNAFHAYTLSQLLHGEQAAMVAAGRLTQVMPGLSAKLFAAQQAADEARHVELVRKLISEKVVGHAYAMDAGVLALITQGLSDARWDFAVLTTQILLEGLALGTLQQMRDFSRNKLIKTIATNIMVDEARHVAYGLSELERYYHQLTDLELRERAEFAREGLNALQARLNPMALGRALGLPDMAGEASKVASGQQRMLRQLCARVEAMLAKLRLGGGASEGVSPAERLAAWARADQEVARAMSN